MALNERQTELYVHIVTLYKPRDLVIESALTHSVAEPDYPNTPTYSGVKCYRNAKREVNQAELVGMTLTTNLFTIDEWHFDVAQEIDTNWAIQFLTPGHPDYGMWFLVIGQSQVKNYRANKLSLLAKRSTKPRMVA